MSVLFENITCNIILNESSLFNNLYYRQVKIVYSSMKYKSGESSLIIRVVFHCTDIHMRPARPITLGARLLKAKPDQQIAPRSPMQSRPCAQIYAHRSLLPFR